MKVLSGLKVSGELVVPVFAGDMPSPPNGAVWYNALTGKLRGRENDTSADLVSAAGGSELVSVATVNFGAGSHQAADSFTVSGAQVGANVQATVSSNMPVGVDADELEMDPLVVVASVSAEDTVSVTVFTADPMQRATGQRNINLRIAA